MPRPIQDRTQRSAGTGHAVARRNRGDRTALLGATRLPLLPDDSRGDSHQPTLPLATMVARTRHRGTISRTGLTEPCTILDASLPLPAGNAKPAAKAVVSTKRKNYETIPRLALLADLGRRVLNVRNHQQALGNNASPLPTFTEFEKPWLSNPQPLRTDCENKLSGVDFVDVEIES